ncbi:type II secretion system protein N [Crenobacter caeni]|uniref:Type II secretion system protein GspC N-terminal domain-containing protein n=1 Tax=Crenobacter caeni TaxID=2705474 RepID=A0A6B2KTP9_9NEIS|nr:type II secretion system protein N [Crenobacter caeni]NDV13347.1 hypothetical protein [Crenobacter caeni]
MGHLMPRLPEFARWRTPPLARLAPALPWLVALACAFWLGGSLSVLLAPPVVRALPLSQPVPAADSGRVAALHWFGEVPAVPVNGAPTGALRLVGVYSSGNARTDFALVDEGGQVKPWRVGQQMAGATLLRVLPRAVVLREGAAERELVLAGPAGGAAAAAAAVPAVPPQTVPPVMPAPSVPDAGTPTSEPVPSSPQPAPPAVPHNPD